MFFPSSTKFSSPRSKNNKKNTPKKVTPFKPKQTWNEYLTDISEFKLSTEETLRRKSLLLSKNNILQSDDITPSSEYKLKHTTLSHTPSKSINNVTPLSKSKTPIQTRSVSKVINKEEDDGSDDDEYNIDTNTYLNDISLDLNNNTIKPNTLNKTYRKPMNIISPSTPLPPTPSRKPSIPTYTATTTTTTPKHATTSTTTPTASTAKHPTNKPTSTPKTSTKNHNDEYEDKLLYNEIVLQIQQLMQELKYYEEISGRRSCFDHNEINTALISYPDGHNSDLFCGVGGVGGIGGGSKDIMRVSSIMRVLVQMVSQSMTYLLESEVEMQRQKALNEQLLGHINASDKDNKQQLTSTVQSTPLRTSQVPPEPVRKQLVTDTPAVAMTPLPPLKQSDLATPLPKTHATRQPSSDDTTVVDRTYGVTPLSLHSDSAATPLTSDIYSYTTYHSQQQQQQHQQQHHSVATTPVYTYKFRDLIEASPTPITSATTAIQSSYEATTGSASAQGQLFESHPRQRDLFSEMLMTPVKPAEDMKKLSPHIEFDKQLRSYLYESDELAARVQTTTQPRKIYPALHPTITTAPTQAPDYQEVAVEEEDTEQYQQQSSPRIIPLDHHKGLLINKRSPRGGVVGVTNNRPAIEPLTQPAPVPGRYDRAPDSEDTETDQVLYSTNKPPSGPKIIMNSMRNLIPSTAASPFTLPNRKPAPTTTGARSLRRDQPPTTAFPPQAPLTKDSRDIIDRGYTTFFNPTPPTPPLSTTSSSLGEDRETPSMIMPRDAIPLPYHQLT